VTATTGIDVLCHAIEAYVSLQGNIITDTLAVEVIKLVGKHLRKAYTNRDDREARRDMSYPSLLTGLAFRNAGTVLGDAAGYAYVYPATDVHLPTEWQLELQCLI